MYLSKVTIDGFRAGAAEGFSCEFPDRFCLIAGPNNAGKTTVCEALYLAHSHRFPALPRPSSAVLGPTPRAIGIEFAFGGEGQEGPLGQSLSKQSLAPPRWTRRLERSLGRVRTVGIADGEHAEETRLIYLPAHRNPVDELAKREAEVLVQLLRAEQERQQGHRNLANLRVLAEQVLDRLVSHQLIESVESRVKAYLGSLSSGVIPQHPYVGRQDVDDAFLARVLEFLMSAVEQRSMAQRLEVSGLGYVNLLHIAVTLAAVPGGGALPDASSGVGSQSATMEQPDSSAETPLPEPRARILSAENEAEAVEDSFFPELFHATIVIEEPEAHLHPQLQHGVMRYLRRVTIERPELQVIVSTHSPEMICACQPKDLVILRQAKGTRIARSVAQLPLSPDKLRRVLRMTALHLDATRSSSLFAERLALVEGVTDGLLLRKFGRAWASDDRVRQAFIDALTIVPMGSKVGEWPAQLLGTQGHELAERVAILRDTDDRSAGPPEEPLWLPAYADTVRCFHNHPTLEPSITRGNEDLVRSVLEGMNIESPTTVTAETVDDLFHNGSGQRRKGEFAYLMAELFDAALETGQVSVPSHMTELFDFLSGGAVRLGDAGPENVELQDASAGTD